MGGNVGVGVAVLRAGVSIGWGVGVFDDPQAIKKTISKTPTPNMIALF